MVGHIRFHSRPEAEYLHLRPRRVEFGYVVFDTLAPAGLRDRSGARRDALGSRAARRAAVRGNGRTRQLSVATRRDERLGFRKVGEQVDEIDGVEDVFHRDDQPASR